MLTVEGLQHASGALHPVQQAFIDELAPQCGYCTPGQIMATVALLKENPQPTREEARQALSGNLCRCGAYEHYLNAVMRASGAAAETGAGTMSYTHIGKNFVPPDIFGKVTGKAKYAEDYSVDGMVYARLYTSPMPHARVRHIDASAALAMDGVLGILTADDVPAVEAPNAAILTNEPVYIGDPILAIAAVDEKTAENALRLIRVDLEPLPFVVDPIDSLKPGGRSARTEGNVYPGEVRELKWSGEDVERFVTGREPTGAAPTEWSYGDLEAGFDNAAVVVEESFVTTGYAHMSMEPRSVMSYWQNGKCHVYGSTQSQSFVVPFLARLLGIDQADLVYVSEYCGGGFGSKISAYPSLALPGYFSKKLGRPVMLRITREEEYYIGSARVGFQGWVKAGFTAEGRVSAVDLYIVQDLGPNRTGGDASSAGGAVSILYQPDAMRLRDVPVFTNTTPRGAQRGPGQNQIAAVFEPIMDKAARELGIDPVDIRRRNAPDSSATLDANQGPVTSAYMEDALVMGAELFNWSERKKAQRRTPRQQGHRHRCRPGLSLGRCQRVRRSGAHHAGREDSSAQRSRQPGHLFLCLYHPYRCRSPALQLGQLHRASRQQCAASALEQLPGGQQHELYPLAGELGGGHGRSTQDAGNRRSHPRWQRRGLRLRR